MRGEEDDKKKKGGKRAREKDKEKAKAKVGVRSGGKALAWEQWPAVHVSITHYGPENDSKDVAIKGDQVKVLVYT